MTSKERDKKVEDNLGLVHACAKKFTGRGVDYEDIVAAGCIGLIKAVDNFDESRGIMLSTYAVPAILGEIKRIWRDGGSIKVSRSIKELSLKIIKLNEINVKECGSELTVSQLSQKLNVSTDDITEAISSSRLPLSLNAFDGDEDEKPVEIPVSFGEEGIVEKLSLHQAISELECEEQKIIHLRYFKNKTQTQTAKLLNTTQVQISRREKKILMKIRNKLTG